MYNQVYGKMIECGLAMELDEPEWQNVMGERVDEQDAVGQSRIGPPRSNADGR